MSLEKLFVAILCMAFSAPMAASIAEDSAKASEIRTGQGAFTLPEGFTHERTGTADSHRGVLRRKADGFQINVDVGIGAGTHMHEGLQADSSYFRSHTVNGLSALTGIESKDGRKTITTTITDLKAKKPVVANFWATIRSEADVADFLMIVSTFTPPADPAASK